MNLLWIVVDVSLALAAELKPIEPVEFSGDLTDPTNISGVAVVDNFLVIASDEIASVEVLRRRDRGHYDLEQEIPLRDDEKEIDLEGVAYDGKWVYAIGSHSAVRKKVDNHLSRKDNRDLLLEVNAKKPRDQLYRFQLTKDGELQGDIEQVSLRSLLDDDDLLQRFVEIPGKENGLDIEGIAAKDGNLLIGLRGPVLRGGYVPVLALRFKHPEQYEIRYVRLDGLGIRDLAAVNDGYLILAGPVSEDPSDFQLFTWDGRDMIPNHGVVEATLTPLGSVETPPGGKAEGITILSENNQEYEALIVYDGPQGGAPGRFKVKKP